MKSTLIRQKFLAYFNQFNHEIVPSSSLIPHNDPTLLFTNAGMVQFKDVFLGHENRNYSRAASVQRCVRAGGKHNDLENVGHTKRHHTFFEMLGNFSFGDYFKLDAIRFAWKFLVEVLNLPPEKLWISVFENDLESEKIWLEEIGIDQSRLIRCGEKDNFWSMGEIGPCGPCTEIYYDHGPSLSGGLPGTLEPDGDRYVEIWNLVFMQYNRDKNGNLNPLPRPCVDTGMGLERISAVMHQVHDNYETDLFLPLLQSLAKIINNNDFKSPSMRVIVDHIRSASFLIADGVFPSNEGRGYVLRRIIRRAIRHGYQLNHHQPFLFMLAETFVNQMQDTYPILKESAILIQQILKQEEIQFSQTLENGMRIFEEGIKELTDEVIPGVLAFQLYDTYGFPLDLTADIARERNLKVDYAGFDKAMKQQRQQSKQAHHFKVKQIFDLHGIKETNFTGYEKTVDTCSILAILVDDKKINQLEVNQPGIIILDKTPFYAESGGQIGDKGLLLFSNGFFQVEDTQKQGQIYLHKGELKKGTVKIGDPVEAEVSESRRDILLNHSATHLLHEALRKILGSHVLQKGSLVAAERLRFDFAHSKPLSDNEVDLIEMVVNQQIRANHQSHVHETSLEEAKTSGALALFGEKYGKKVRVVSMGDFSVEVCGGTHVNSTGEIGLFKIVNETGVAAGIRRIEALTGPHALQWVQQKQSRLKTISNLLKVGNDEVLEKIEQILLEQRQLQKQLEILQKQIDSQKVSALQEQVKDIAGIKVIAAELNVDRENLRQNIDQLKQKWIMSAIILASTQEDKVYLVAGVSKACLKFFTAPDLLNFVAKQLNGKGGGRDDLAQGGAESAEKLVEALASVESWVKSKINLVF